jgi:hypothetical protein
MVVMARKRGRAESFDRILPDSASMFLPSSISIFFSFFSIFSVVSIHDILEDTVSEAQIGVGARCFLLLGSTAHKFKSR